MRDSDTWPGKVLLLGFSDIARRRVIPALVSLGVRQLEVASVSAGVVECPGIRYLRRFDDYRSAIEQTDAEIAYISTMNSLHFELAMLALERGLHVIIDKPACLSLAEAKAMRAKAGERERCLAEAKVYAYHPRFARILEAFREAGGRPCHAVAFFSIPPRAPENFRYHARLGGGAILDLGPYAVDIGLLLFGDCPASEIVGRALTRRGDVDSAFSFFATYAGGQSTVGAFGFTTEYVNRLDIAGLGLAVSIDRAFSALPNATTHVAFQRADRTSLVRVAPADTFALFFADVFDAIARGDHKRFADRLVLSAQEMDRLRGSVALAARSRPDRESDPLQRSSPL